MTWPPTIGRPIPLADQPAGVTQKLASYCLNLDHEIGGPKARGFQRILGISRADLEYLAKARDAFIEALLIDSVTRRACGPSPAPGRGPPLRLLADPEVPAGAGHRDACVLGPRGRRRDH